MTSVKRTVWQRSALIGAALLGAAPLGVGIVQKWVTGYDARWLLMAVIPTFFAVGLLVSTIGRRRSRRAVRIQTASIFAFGTIFAGGTAVLIDPLWEPTAWGVAVAVGLCLAGASVLIALSRPSTP